MASPKGLFPIIWNSYKWPTEHMNETQDVTRIIPIHMTKARLEYKKQSWMKTSNAPNNYVERGMNAVCNKTASPKEEEKKKEKGKEQK